MKEKATIFDYARMCRTNDCESCPFKMSGKGENVGCAVFIIANTEKANKIILKWCKEHPVETRQDRFLKMFPNAQLVAGVINIDPCDIEKELLHPNDGSTCREYRKVGTCTQCRKEYWLAEVEKNGDT